MSFVFGGGRVRIGGFAYGRPQRVHMREAHRRREIQASREQVNAFELRLRPHPQLGALQYLVGSGSVHLVFDQRSQPV